MNTQIYMVEREEAQQALSESEQRYKRLLEATTDYIYTVTLEQAQAKETKYGLGCEAVTGYTPREFETDPGLWYRIILEEDRPAVMDQIERIRRDEVPPPLEHRIIHKNGRVRWIRNTCIPHRDGEARLVAYDGLITDITPRKHVEELLATLYSVACELATASSLAKAMPGVLQTICSMLLWDYAAYWMVDTQTGLLRRQAAWLRGSPGSEGFPATPEGPSLASGDGLPGQVWASGQPAWMADLSAQDEPVRASLPAGFNFHCGCACPVRMRNEVCGVIEVFSHEIWSRDPHMLEVLAEAGLHLGEFIERKQAEEALHQAQARLAQVARFETIGTLAACVAHDVKNPLQVILGGLDLLSGRLASPDEVLATTLSDMREAVTCANTIMSELRAISSPRDTQMTLEDLNTLVQHALHLVRKELEAAKVAVETRLAGDLPRVLVERCRLYHVFINLFINAKQAMPQGGTLTVSTRAATGKELHGRPGPVWRLFPPAQSLLLVEIQDTGAGIKKEDLPKIFDLFFTTKPPGEGTGLGLPIVKRIIESHGGALDIGNAPSGGVLATVIFQAGASPG
jgi:PAS domain S-box-containing protein